jgi:signal transduction histidine kinase
MSVAQAAVGAAWLGVAWTTLQREADDERRQLNEMNDTLLKTARDQRERLHELRSTVAGLVTGSALLDRPDLPAETRQHLWESVCRELERMERLLSNQDDPATDLDLDQTLGLILDLQRLKGRRVEFHSSGDSVCARYDALAEVVNILMDNAVTHGGSDSSVVEVARRDDEVVDITVTDFGRGIPREQREHIFEWGRRGTDSPGEGIGLHVAQRLINENGGSLRCAEPKSGSGTSFVISLPAARVSAENFSTSATMLLATDEDRHVASRHAG